MEAALVSGLLKPAAGKLIPLISSEFASLIGVKNDLCQLQHLFGEITNKLSAVGDNKVTDSDPSFYWLKDLKDVAYDFDDLLNKVYLEDEKHKLDIECDKHVMTNCFCAKPKAALSRLEMAQEMKKIKKRFAKVVKQRTDVNTIASSLVVEHPDRHINKSTGEMSILVNIDEKKVLGRDEVKHEIVSKLVESGTHENISIVSIVGLGGSGKTTLAKYICQDNKIEKHFASTWWVHVSQEFNVEKLIGKLFESVADKKSEFHTLQHMTRVISEKLSRKKFLLVLDDVWNEDQHDWEQFEQHFSSSAPGSKILLAARDGKVAEVVKSTYILNLAFLSDVDSWKLFQQCSGWAEEVLDSEFTEVGKAIVKNCIGVPLAIKSLAGVLRGKRGIKEWQNLRDSNLLSGDIQGRVLGSLKLSYFHLSDDLKHCVLLCSIFPKGYLIYKGQLISQWIVHGFVKPMNGAQRPEDVGSDYFHSLLKVSFLQDIFENISIGAITCKMHDLVHDLTREILQDEIVVIPKKTSSDHNQRCRYLSFTPCTEKVDRKLFNKARALFVTGESFATNKAIKKVCCVRSVVLENIYNTSFPLFVLKFEYLAYLRIHKVGYGELPEAIADCWNLQALHVVSCYQLLKLPESIGRLKKLRTLELSWIHVLETLPQSIGDCHNLETLHVLNCPGFKQIPDSIRKNEKLLVLNIVNCGSLRQLPPESLGMLQNLRTINLTRCKSVEELPCLFACGELHTLILRSVSELTMLPQCITSLRNLQHLDLQFCMGLVELPGDIRNIKRLEVLNLEGCNRLRGMPAGFGQLTRLQTLGLFVIGGSSKHAGISELRNLDRLRGVLKIEGVWYVKDPDDAKKANLNKKNNIEKLMLNWLSRGQRIGGNTGEKTADMEKELGVLNGLEPPSGIKELEILNYEGLHLPCWMSKERHSCNLDSKDKQVAGLGLPHFPYLTKMMLDCFPKLKHLQGLAGLPSLKNLTLAGFDTLESISTGPFPSLTRLIISGMPNLLELSTTAGITLTDEDGVTVCGNPELQCYFPNLATLAILWCPKLNVRPWFPASLESLSLERSNKRLLSFCPVRPHGNDAKSPSSLSNTNVTYSCLGLLKNLQIGGMKGPSSSCGWELLRNVTALESLEIWECDELGQLHESIRSLTALQSLYITECPGLVTLPELPVELFALEKLTFLDCKNMKELPDGIQYLTSLQELTIHTCDALEHLPNRLGELCSLRILWIDELPRLSCLPESMRGLTSLDSLTIAHCVALTMLPEWIGQLSALRSLRIMDCHGITSLPRSIERLTALEELKFTGSHDLTRRYYEQGPREDWPRLSHIRLVLIY